MLYIMYHRKTAGDEKDAVNVIWIGVTQI